MTVEDKVREKLKKVLALTTSPDVGEAAAATATLKRLMEQHGVIMDDLVDVDICHECGAVDVLLNLVCPECRSGARPAAHPTPVRPKKPRALDPVNMSLFGDEASAHEVISGQVTWIAPGSQAMSNWRAGRINSGGENVKFVGACMVKAGDSVRLHGEWEDDKKWGRQFKVAYATAAIGRDYDAIRSLLETDPSFRQIGPKRALYIANFLRDRDLDLECVLESDELLDDLQREAKLPDEAIDHLVESWSKRREENIAKAELISLGVPTKSLDAIWQGMGRFALEAIKSNPYVLTETIDRFWITDADKIAKTLGISDSDPRRIVCGIMLTMRREVLGNGHTWISRRKLAALTVNALQIGRAGDHRKTADTLDELVEKGRLTAVEVPGIDADIVCDPELLRSERKFSGAFATDLKDEVNLYFVQKPLEDGWVEPVARKMDKPGKPPFVPSEQQVAAVQTFTSRRKIAVTGAAGTGKTATVTMILRVCHQAGLKISIAAPTGRAAMRLHEMILDAKLELPTPPMTIHKLLGYQGDRWMYNEVNKLPCDVLILDEMSMTDIGLMAKLIDALRPTTSVVLVGDHNQLPPVGPGAAFRDVIESELCHVIRLGTVFRQAGALRQNAADVLRGVVRPTTRDGDVETWRLEDWHANSVHAHDSIAEHYRDKLLSFEGYVDRDKKLDPTKGLFEVQVLSPMYKGNVGIDALNETLRAIAHEIIRGETIDPKRPIGIGDKVIQTKNDYQVGLMNGDQGVVESTSGFVNEAGWDEPGWVVEVQRGENKEKINVPLSRTSGFMLAYAISVHRFQGSEAQHVIGAVHSEHAHMLTRPLIYTMSTRASKTLTLIGDRGVHEGARKDEQAHRRTLTAPQWLVKKFRRDPSA